MADWTRHAKGKKKQNNNRRLALTITPELEKALAIFRGYHSKNSTLEFTDTAIVMTMIEAGFQEWAKDVREQPNPSTPTSPVAQPKPKRKPTARIVRPESKVTNGDPNIDPEEVGYNDYEDDDSGIPYTP